MDHSGTAVRRATDAGAISSEQNRLTERLIAAVGRRNESSPFEHLTNLAAKVMQSPVAFVSTFESPASIDDVLHGAIHSGDEISLVAHAVSSPDVMVISDTHLDPRFEGDVHVVGEPHVRYFASAPLHLSDGTRMGTLCVVDTAPHGRLRSNEIDAMEALAAAIIADHELNDANQLVRDQELVLERLHELQVIKDEFVATVSHELRTPLTSIVASLDLLVDGSMIDLPSDARGIVEIARSNSHRLIDLVDQILDLERMEWSDPGLSIESVRPEELVSTAFEAVGPSAAARGVWLDIERNGIVTEFACDRGRIIQVLVNILGNAVKFSPENTTVTVRIESDAESISFVVRDQGIGIAPEAIERLFEPFWQVDSTASRVVGGSGLGLAISKRIVDRHNGRIEVESSESRTGSAFRIVLPLRQD